MSPRGGSTRLDGGQPAAPLPEPVTVGRCEQPAFSTAGQQDRPSLTTPAPGAKSRFAIFSTALSRKPSTTLGRRRSGLRSAVVSMAATIGVLPAAPSGPQARPARQEAPKPGVAVARAGRVAGE